MKLLGQSVGLHLQLRYEGAAFKRAEFMILLNLKNGRGRRRCRLIAENQGSLPLAISFFERGVNHLSISDPYHALLT